MKQYPFYSIKRIINATGYSLEGLLDTYKTEAAFRLEIILFAILLPIALMLEVTSIERILLISSLLLVLIFELANTAIEAAINRISQDHNPLSKKAKDAGSAIVLLAVLNAVLVWVVIIYDMLR